MPGKKHNEGNKVLLFSRYTPLFIILSIRKLNMHYFGLPTLFSYYSTYIEILLLHPDTYSTYIQIIQKLLALKHILTLQNTTIKIYYIVILQIQICTHEFKYACIDIRLTFYKSLKKRVSRIQHTLFNYCVHADFLHCTLHNSKLLIKKM